jgi:hypothetical protein
MNFLDERLPQRFWDKCTPVPFAGCWLWFGGARNELGYGNFRATTERAELTHRYAYTLLVGPIAEGMSIDHLCNTPCCVNPAHMEVVTLAENSRREGERRRIAGIKQVKPRGTHCKCGRPYDRVNGTTQVCTFCHKARMRAYREGKRAGTPVCTRGCGSDES